jgi:O-acetyl-ADP-ribose deacetylase (regulator of RNase III)
MPLRYTTLHYVQGDATAPIGEGHKVIVHICNDLGRWGKGFVLAISKRWKQPEIEYKAAFSGATPPALGDVQFVNVTGDITVANIIGQHGIARKGSPSPPIRYNAVKQGLEKVAAFANRNRATIHMPRIGCGLAGGNWEEIKPIITETLVDAGLTVTVYDFVL